ncbi:MAG TPA: LacI family DNA-binding transcriptional regulator [Terriglobales bacterium]|nr:LacI family DNA-binding transcriptional regulator [Terriglobales bacterium]
MRGKKGSRRTRLEPVSQRMLADYLGLSPATVSLVLNSSPVADSIPQETKDRVFAAARHFDYRPNFVARSLRTQRSFMIGVLVPEVSEGYAASVVGGIEDQLLQEGYFYLVASHRHRLDLIEEYPRVLYQRSVEGLIAVDTPWNQQIPIPVVAVSGRGQAQGVTNIVLDHDRAAELALEHLFHLGHRRVAFIKGQAFSSDTEVRWNGICKAAKRIGLEIRPELIVQLEGDSPSPEVGYGVTHKLLASRGTFTALFAFNDISAIGAIRALRESGRRVPEDVSVVGFDDIQSAAFQNPGLTTVRQPLRRMGSLAAETVLRSISSPAADRVSRRITVEPELVVRESTCPASTRKPGRA